MILNKSKCEVSKENLEFMDTHSPKTSILASEIRSLLGMTNYCSRFITDYATKTEPLCKLTHKNQPWCWTAEHDRAVSELKEALASAPVTAYFDPEKDTEISVGPVSLAAILTQVIICASRSLTTTEQRYRQTEREALAIIWTWKHLHL